MLFEISLCKFSVGTMRFCFILLESYYLLITVLSNIFTPALPTRPPKFIQLHINTLSLMSPYHKSVLFYLVYGSEQPTPALNQNTIILTAPPAHGLLGKPLDYRDTATYNNQTPHTHHTQSTPSERIRFGGCSAVSKQWTFAWGED